MLQAGDVLPNVAVIDTDGNSLSLGSFKGKAVVVYFYPKADTPGCTNEAKDFTELAGDFAKAGIPVIGISKDKPAKLAKFRDKYDLKVLLASDEAGGVCEAFGTWIEKSLYGRKYMGMERASFLVDAKGVIAQAWHKVKVPGHVETVLAAARAL